MSFCDPTFSCSASVFIGERQKAKNQGGYEYEEKDVSGADGRGPGFLDAGRDGIDSNGNVNLIGGSAEIHSGAVGGEAGIDYDGQLYVGPDFQLNNQSGAEGPEGMGGMPGEMGGQMPGEMGGQMPGQMSGIPGQMGGQQPGMGGQMPGGGFPNMP